MYLNLILINADWFKLIIGIGNIQMLDQLSFYLLIESQFWFDHIILFLPIFINTTKNKFGISHSIKWLM